MIGTYRNTARPLDPSDYPPGTLGVIGQELSKFHSFTGALSGVLVKLPPGSAMRIQCGVDVCGNLNQIIRRMEGEWLWIMGDDHVFTHDILLRQLQHLGKADIIVPHCLKRNPGWEPVVYSHQDEDGWYHIAELPEKGLTEVWAAGSAGMLITREVLDAIGDPWFTPGDLGLAEDVEFCRKAREAGFRIACDPEILLGHTSIHTVWPSFRKGRWHLELNHDQQMTVPIDRIHEEYEPTPLVPLDQVPA